MSKFAFCLVIAASALVGLAHADPVKVKLGHFASDTEETYTGAIKPWAEAVNAEAKGAIVIELFPNGALGRNLPPRLQRRSWLIHPLVALANIKKIRLRTNFFRSLLDDDVLHGFPRDATD